MKHTAWIWHDYFSGEYITSLINKIEDTVELKDAVVGGLTQDTSFLHTSYRKTQTGFLNPQDFPEVIREGEELMKVSNMNAFNFDMVGGLDSCQYAIYGLEGFYNWHMDTFLANDTLYERKITLIIQLSDPSEYEGGTIEFEDMGGTEAPTSKGSVIAFPSFIRHRVTPVTKGIRKSLVFWFLGPAFR
jgi:PKHD-type hydroxylase